MGAGERRRRGNIQMLSANTENPAAATMALVFARTFLIVAVIMTIIGFAYTMVAYAAQVGTVAYKYTGPILLGLGIIFGIVTAVLCVVFVKPSCCYPGKPTVLIGRGAGIGGNACIIGGRACTTGQSNIPPPPPGQYSTQPNQYGVPPGYQFNSQPNQYGLAPTQYGTPQQQPTQYGMPPPQYETVEKYGSSPNAHPSPQAMYPPPPPAYSNPAST